MHTLFDLPLGPVLHVSSPNYYRGAPAGMSERDYSRQLAAELDSLIEREGADTVAAFFAEPVMGAGGLIPPPEGYFEEIVPVLERHDVLLVLDEVVSGFGRLGTYWGSQAYNLRPDLITAAKGITSGYFPMSACLVSPKIWDVIEGGADKAGLFAHGYTYSAHPVGAAVALATLRAIDGEGIVQNAAVQGAHLQRAMREAVGSHALVGNIRGAGMMIGIELVKDKATKEPFPAANRTGRRVLQAVAERGLITRALGDTLVFAPPLVVTKEDVSELIAIFKSGLDKVANEIL
jgi:L-2,4-diaminobutyrate transaminase